MTPATASASTEPRWAAVLRRDRAADGQFVYAVHSTGVYCRPSCPSRRPRPDRVAFFDAPALAAAAGFRACRRCQPDAAQAPATRTAAAVARARDLLDRATAAGGERVPLAELARATGVSAAHLQRAFTEAVGLSPARYAAACRASRWKAALRRERTVSQAVYAAGYAAPSRAYAAAASHLGMTPAAYRRGGEGARLWWTTFDTPLGRALAAATGRGVCAVLLAGEGETAAEADDGLAAALAAEYPRAERRPAAEADQGDEEAAAALALLDAAAAAVRAAAGGTTLPEGAPPVDAPGTPWQQEVWRALQAIPAGATRTYAELAGALGRPGAARAVARACATNRVALLVPCHRVVPAGAAERGFALSAVSGYRWGPARKAGLLARERTAAAE